MEGRGRRIIYPISVRQETSADDNEVKGSKKHNTSLQNKWLLMTTFIQKALGLLVFVFRSNSLCTFFVKILVTWLVGQIKWQGFHKVRRYSILQASSLFGEYCENSATRATQEGVQEWGVGGVEKAPLCSCATPWCVCLSCFTRYFGRGGGGGELIQTLR